MHLRGDGQAAFLGARADDESVATPGDVLSVREWRVPVPVAEGPSVLTTPGASFDGGPVGRWGGQLRAIRDGA
jgi:hypothetical protein